MPHLRAQLDHWFGYDMLGLPATLLGAVWLGSAWFGKARQGEKRRPPVSSLGAGG
jgi:hypothetical protein